MAVAQYLVETAKADVNAKAVSEWGVRGGMSPPALPPHSFFSFIPHSRFPLPGASACVSPQNGGYTPLHEASRYGEVAVVRYLVDKASI